MKTFLQAASLLAVDMASSLLFVVLLFVTHNLVLAVGVAIMVGIGQIVVQRVRGKSVESMEWLSLFLVIASGIATLLTDNPRFVLLKPSAIYAIIGLAMLKPGWMTRYLPPLVQTVSPDIATRVGFAWAGLMFFSAILNAVLATQYDMATWAAVMAAFGLASKAILFVLGFAAIRLGTRRRLRAMPLAEREAILKASGWPATAGATQPAA